MRRYSHPTYKVDEFLAIGLGGLFLSNKQGYNSYMGTGTLMSWPIMTRLIIGGTSRRRQFISLSNRMLNIRNFNDIVDMAMTET